MEEILKMLCDIRPLTDECLDDLRRFIKLQKVRKDEIILKIGEVNNKLYFIHTGAMHCFHYVGEEEVTDWFFFEREFVVSIGSFYDQVPSEDCIVALEDGEAYYIMHEHFEYLCRTHHCFSELARRLLQKYLVVFHDHPRFIQRHTAAECIRIVRAKLGHLFYRVPRAILASWLDMDPATFSRNQ